MTKEDKELLLKDLCARLPYGVVVKDRNGVHALTSGNTEFTDLFNGKCNIAPYLFPLSSMTDEQKREYYELIHELNVKAIEGEISNADCSIAEVDWLNKYHIDYRGLIEKGLANDATGLNIY